MSSTFWSSSLQLWSAWIADFHSRAAAVVVEIELKASGMLDQSSTHWDTPALPQGLFASSQGSAMTNF